LRYHSLFVPTMPTADRRASPGPDRRRTPRGGRRALDGPGQFPIVLVADTYAGARTPCVRYLDRYGFHVIEAASADDAMSGLARTRPHVIVSGLEGEDAQRLYDRLSRDDELQTVPILVLAADDGITSPSIPGAVLSKPFLLRRLLTELRTILQTTLPSR
jgi:DNA-binding response OmpR family regulator